MITLSDEEVAAARKMADAIIAKDYSKEVEWNEFTDEWMSLPNTNWLLHITATDSGKLAAFLYYAVDGRYQEKLGSPVFIE